METVIAAFFVSAQPSLRVTKGFIEALGALGLARIVVLLLMISALGLQEYKLKPTTPKSNPEERQSLLENGDGSSGNYGSVPAAAPGSARRTQVSGTGWLEYFAGFKVLFPYLWYEAPTPSMIAAADISSGQKTRQPTK